MPFYESLRTALARYEVGVHSAQSPATKQQIIDAETRLGCPIPSDYQAFLSSFNGVLLFHEAVQLFSTVDPALCIPHQGYVRIGEIPQGTLWMSNNGTIFCVDESAPDPIRMASGVEPFLDAIIAREGLLVDYQGEFVDVFDDEGELQPSICKKQAKAGQKKEPTGAFFFYEQAELELMEDNVDAAQSLLRTATTLDPNAGPCLEMLASLYHQSGSHEEAEMLFVKAAQSSIVPSLSASRFLQAATLAPPHRQSGYAQSAWHADQAHAHWLCLQVESLLQEDADEAELLYQKLKLLMEHAPVSALTDELREAYSSLQKKFRVRTKLKVI